LLKNGEKISACARNSTFAVHCRKNGGRVFRHDELLEKVWGGLLSTGYLEKGVSGSRHILEETRNAVYPNGLRGAVTVFCFCPPGGAGAARFYLAKTEPKSSLKNTRNRRLRRRIPPLENDRLASGPL